MIQFRCPCCGSPITVPDNLAGRRIRCPYSNAIVTAPFVVPIPDEDWWKGCAHPRAMLNYLRGKASGRKLRLFSCACCRLFWDDLTDARSRQAVEVAEAYADGQADGEELASADVLAHDAFQSARLLREQSSSAASRRAYHLAEAASLTTFRLKTTAFETTARVLLSCQSLVAGEEARRKQLDQTLSILLRDIFSPTSKVRFNPAWLRWNDSRVRRLAESIHHTHQFDTLPILADALEEAGCTDPLLMDHCRFSGPHARGCWALDLLRSVE